MRCLFVFSNFPHQYSDSGGWITEFLSHLSEKNIEIFVLVPFSKGSQKIEKYKNITIFRYNYFFPKRCQILANSRGGIPYIIHSNPLAIIQIPFFSFIQFIYMVNIVKKYKIDVINTHWAIPQGFIGSLTSSITKVPNVTTIHSSEITILTRIPFKKSIASTIINHSSRIVSVSRHRYSEFVSLIDDSANLKNSNKVIFIPMGVEVPKISCGFNSIIDQNILINKKIILFVGRLVEVKGLDYLLKSIKLVIEQEGDHKVVLLVAGDGPLKSKYKNMVNDLKIIDHVIFLGEVKHSDLWNYYSIADVVVVPSIVDSSGYQEGLPVVVIEALSSGRPVIGTRTNGIMELIIDGVNGLLVESENSQDLKDKIIKVLSDKDVAHTLSKNAASSVRQYNWKKISDEYYTIFQDSIG